MKKLFKSLLLIACLFSGITASAHDFESGGIYYNITSRTGKTVEVTYQDDDYNSYSGAVVIPASVTYGAKIYSVTSIGEKAFRFCVGLTSVTIPNSVTSIERAAFSGCENLTSVTIPNSVTTISYYAFDECTGLTAFIVDSANPSYSAKDGVLFNKDQTTLVAYPIAKSTTYTIPNSVTSIGEKAFRFCVGLTSVTIPNTVTTISNDAFAECTGLTAFIVDSANPSYSAVDGVLFNKDQTTLVAYPNARSTTYTIPNSVTSIGEFAFRSCEGFTSFTIPNSVTSIKRGAFSNCKNLTSITIGNSVTSIENFAFFLCQSLTSITIGNSVTSIGNNAFSGCKSLTSITIPNSVTSIGNNAFRECVSLTSVTIPNSVTSLGKWVFQDCVNLTSVTIPNSVTSLGESFFWGCTGLKKIYNYSKTPQFLGDYNTFDKTKVTLYVPKGCTGAYRAAGVWGEIDNIQEFDATQP